MVYSFPEIDHSVVYPRTFLKDVAIYISFQQRNTIDCKDKIRSYFYEEFDISEDSNIEFDKINSLEGLKIASSDSFVIFKFHHSAVSIKIKYPAYKKFADIFSLLPKLKAYIKIFDVSLLECVRIAKFNELMFNCKDDSFPIKEIMSSIFSVHLMKEVTDNVSDFSKLARMERLLDFHDDTTEVEIAYGYAKNEINPKKGVLTLKTSVENKSALEVEDLEEMIQSYNRLVDRVFHWCVTKDIINKMESHE